MTTIRYETTPDLANPAMNDLFAAAWDGHSDRDFRPVLDRSLVYLGAFDDSRLVGFINIAWDGGVHGFVLDPTVHPAFQHRGIGSELLRRAAAVAADRGLEWLHVDFVSTLTPFYARAGFTPTAAGLLRLRA
jgi:GNAT superfamily N-acetyltransferase